jgi:hypothetical protein
MYRTIGKFFGGCWQTVGYCNTDEEFTHNEIDESNIVAWAPMPDIPSIEIEGDFEKVYTVAEMRQLIENLQNIDKPKVTLPDLNQTTKDILEFVEKVSPDHHYVLVKFLMNHPGSCIESMTFNEIRGEFEFTLCYAPEFTVDFIHVSSTFNAI